MYTYIYNHVYIYIYVCMYLSMCMYIYIYIFTILMDCNKHSDIPRSGVPVIRLIFHRHEDHLEISLGMFQLFLMSLI